MNYNTLAREAHENAVAHGWWDEERPFAEIVGLIHSELSEALEEYRDGHRLDEIYFTDEEDPHRTPFTQFSPWLKPEGIPIELADAMIRVLDLLEHKKVKIDQPGSGWMPIHVKDNMDTLPGFLAACHWLVSATYEDDWNTKYYYLKALLYEISEFCQRVGIDLESAVKIKMAYNKTRPHKHGKKI